MFFVILLTNSDKAEDTVESKHKRMFTDEWFSVERLKNMYLWLSRKEFQSALFIFISSSLPLSGRTCQSFADTDSGLKEKQILNRHVLCR